MNRLSRLSQPALARDVFLGLVLLAFFVFAVYRVCEAHNEIVAMVTR